MGKSNQMWSAQQTAMKHWVSDEFQQNPEISHFWILLRRAAQFWASPPKVSGGELLAAAAVAIAGRRWSRRSERRVVAESGPAPPAAEEKPPVGCLVSNLQVNNHQAASQPLQEKSSAKELKKEEIFVRSLATAETEHTTV